MKTKRTKHNGMYLAALLLAGLMIAVVAGTWLQSGDDGLLAAAPADRKVRAIHARLVSDIDIVMKNLIAVEKTVKDGKSLGERAMPRAARRRSSPA